MKYYRTVSEVLHGFDVDCLCVGWDGKNIWMTERGKYAMSRGYNTVDLGFASTSYERRLMKYGVMGIGIYVSDIENYNILERPGYYWANIEGLSLIIYLNRIGRVNTTPDYGESTELHIDMYSYSTRFTHAMSELEKVLNKEEIEDFMRLRELPVDFNILYKEYDIEGPISIIGSYFHVNDRSVIDLLTISERVYMVMQDVDGITIPRQPEIIIPVEGEQVTNVSFPVVYNDPEDWYVGAYVSKKDLL